MANLAQTARMGGRVPSVVNTCDFDIKKALPKIYRQSFKSAVRTGLEPATSCVTGRHSNQTELPDLNKIIANF